jgi:hypothetical protein
MKSKRNFLSWKSCDVPGSCMSATLSTVDSCTTHCYKLRSNVQVSVSVSLSQSCKPSFVLSDFRASGSNFLKTISLALSPVGEPEGLWGSKSVDAEEAKHAVWVANAANDCVELWYLCEGDYSMFMGTQLYWILTNCTRLEQLRTECGTPLADKLLYWGNPPPLDYPTCVSWMPPLSSVKLHERDVL